VEIAVDEIPVEEAVPIPVGEELKAARERIGMTLSELAAATRVPMRHLESIERSEFGALPGHTYTVGFVRSYARAVDLNDVAIVNALRVELSDSGHEKYEAPPQNYEPADPARVPSKALVWTTAAIAVVVLGAYLVFRSLSLTPAAIVAQKTAAAPATPPIDAAPTPAVPASEDNTVVLTATAKVWVKVYDADQNTLFEQEMAAGDSFTVPEDANKPMIVTGRPQALEITVGGKKVQSIGAADKTVADVDINAKDLLSRAPDAAPTEP
jgi:cytoskeleton protein RodZ